MTDIIKAILKINPNAEVSVNGDDINQITWLNGTTPISQADIQAQFQAVEFDMAMADLRAKRNQDLKDSDYKVLPDSPLTPEQKSAWMTFRTELRNVTQGLNTVEDVNNLDYPDKPE